MTKRRLPALALAALFSAVCALALDVPTGTAIEVRLNGKVSTQNARANDLVDATVIAPVLVGDQFAVPAGAVMHGVVTKVAESTKPDERAVLVLSFTSLEINGVKTPVTTKLVAIDNAREKLDDQGQINGILASETITGQLDSGLTKLEEKYSGLAGVLSAAKNAILKPADTGITYDTGAEMEVQLTAALQLSGPSGPGQAAKVKTIPQEDALLDLVAHEPFQTMAQRPYRPSDVTNLLLIGDETAVRQAFMAAGWSNAAGLNTRAKLETFRALAEDRGYNEAPVSVLLLDGRPPDLVFEKLNNTFAQRHHLRVWRRPRTFLEKPVWAVAATHDIGINFSEQDRTFIHKIDSQIDRERAKVTNDLIFSGHVEGVELVDRPAVPQHGQNATGDNLDTDGRLVVLLLN